MRKRGVCARVCVLAGTTCGMRKRGGHRASAAGGADAVALYRKRSDSSAEDRCRRFNARPSFVVRSATSSDGGDVQERRLGPVTHLLRRLGSP